MLEDSEVYNIFDRINEEINLLNFNYAIHSAKSFNDFTPLIDLLNEKNLTLEQQQEVDSPYRSTQSATKPHSHSKRR